MMSRYFAITIRLVKRSLDDDDDDDDIHYLNTSMAAQVEIKLSWMADLRIHDCACQFRQIRIPSVNTTTTTKPLIPNKLG
jgi:hypothetical protein